MNISFNYNSTNSSFSPFYTNSLIDSLGITGFMNFYDYESMNSLYNFHDIFPRIIPIITRILCKSHVNF